MPEELLDLPVDYEELTEAGSMMGSGGMIVMDDRTCMVDVSRFFLAFLEEESCGKCTPCREGLKQMLHIYDRIIAGRGEDGDLELIVVDDRPAPLPRYLLNIRPDPAQFVHHIAIVRMREPGQDVLGGDGADACNRDPLHQALEIFGWEKGMKIFSSSSFGIPRPLSSISTELSLCIVTKTVSQCPANTSSIELSTTSYTR